MTRVCPDVSDGAYEALVVQRLTLATSASFASASPCAASSNLCDLVIAPDLGTLSVNICGSSAPQGLCGRAQIWSSETCCVVTSHHNHHARTTSARPRRRGCDLSSHGAWTHASPPHVFDGETRVVPSHKFRTALKRRGVSKWCRWRSVNMCEERREEK